MKCASWCVWQHWQSLAIQHVELCCNAHMFQQHSIIVPDSLHNCWGQHCVDYSLFAHTGEQVCVCVCVRFEMHEHRVGLTTTVSTYTFKSELQVLRFHIALCVHSNNIQYDIPLVDRVVAAKPVQSYNSGVMCCLCVLSIEIDNNRSMLSTFQYVDCVASCVTVSCYLSHLTHNICEQSCKHLVIITHVESWQTGLSQTVGAMTHIVSNQMVDQVVCGCACQHTNCQYHTQRCVKTCALDHH